MDNKTDDIILPETSETEISHVAAPSPVPKKHLEPKKLGLIIACAVALLALVGAIIFVVVRSVSVNSEQPAPEPTASIKYDRGELQSALAEASERLDALDFYAAKDILDQYPAVERMTTPQRYRYYELMHRLYLDSSFNDPELASKYAVLAAEAREAILNGEDQ